MTRPEEVLVAENEEGVVVRVTLKDQDMLVIYNLLKKVLVFLTHLDPYNMQEIMIGKLARQIDNSEWSWVNLNKLCWAIGSVSGAMSEDHEKSFLVNVIKDLLGLVDQKRGKDNKAIVAANIMYVVGQYPRFLKAHWRFLKTVVKKLFEFMHETHDGVQDMACDTYIKIAGKTKKCFVVQQAGEPVPFIEEILAHLPAHTAHLNPTQVQTFFEATGILIAAQPNLQQQARLVKDLMKLPNATWDDNMNTASKGIPILESPDHVKTLVQILRVNSAACKTVGAGFELQMEHIYKDMLGMYAASSKVILETLQKDPTTFMRPELRQLRAIKKETLRLVETYMTAAKADAAMLAEQRVLPLLEVTLGDYAQSPPVTRDAEVLTVLATIIDTKLQSYMNAHVHAILGAVFGCTLEMINKELVEFPEHRVGFFRLLEVLVKHCFQAVVMLPTEQFQQLIDSLVWGFKHTMRDIGNRSLGIVETLLDQMQRAPVALANDFYQAYYMRLLQDVFFVLTDAEHRANFSAQCRVLAKLMFIVSSGSATSPLSIEQPAGVNNVEFLRDHLQRLLQNAFPHVNPKAVHVFIIGALELNTDLDRFRPHVRDFLITLREFTATGGAAAVTTADDLYLDERERELEDLKMQQHQRALAVPGLLKPSEKRDDDDDEF
ncbi:CRM1 C terminal-domain-containing protein [Blastocladiella britannica]|nr:CRM1 C terminal-domain-containing protein [Blastocladiella britannica]